MANGLWDRLRGARRIELFAALALAALLALLLLNAAGGDGVSRKTELEARLERVLSQIEGVEGVNAMINQDADGNTTGAVIVVKRLGQFQAYLQLQRAVSTLLELEPDRIEIIGGPTDYGGMS